MNRQKRPHNALGFVATVVVCFTFAALITWAMTGFETPTTAPHGAKGTLTDCPTCEWGKIYINHHVGLPCYRCGGTGQIKAGGF